MVYSFLFQDVFILGGGGMLLLPSAAHWLRSIQMHLDGRRHVGSSVCVSSFLLALSLL